MQTQNRLWTAKFNYLPAKACCGLALLLAGCSGDSVKSIPNLVPVRGTVMLNGKPLAQGSVGFAPVEGGQSASGQIKNGEFTMMTTTSASGVVIGKYKIRVESNEEVKIAPGTPLGPTKPPVSLVPAKYTNPATSGLEANVTKGMAPLKLELDGNK